MINESNLRADKNTCERWKTFDRFGQSVEFTFPGERQYKTSIGALVSLVCISLMIAFVAQRTSKLISRDDPFVTMTSSSNDDSLVALGQQRFMFAISDIDPKLGTIEAHYIKRQKNKQYSFEPIELAQCEELLPGGKHEGKSNNELFDIEHLV